MALAGGLRLLGQECPIGSMHAGNRAVVACGRWRPPRGCTCNVLINVAPRSDCIAGHTSSFAGSRAGFSSRQCQRHVRVCRAPAVRATASSKVNKVVLAYSGGLDTSVILKWLQDTYDCEVITFTADLGQVGGGAVTSAEVASASA